MFVLEMKLYGYARSPIPSTVTEVGEDTFKEDPTYKSYRSDFRKRF